MYRLVNAPVAKSRNNAAGGFDSRLPVVTACTFNRCASARAASIAWTVASRRQRLLTEDVKRLAGTVAEISR
jgi:hypothetical protein